MWCDSLNKSVSKEPLGEPSSKKGKAKATNDEGNKVVEQFNNAVKNMGKMINSGPVMITHQLRISMFSRAGSTSKKSGPSVNQVIDLDAANVITSSFSTYTYTQ